MSEKLDAGAFMLIVNFPPTGTDVLLTEFITGRVAGDPLELNRYGGLKI